MVLPWDGDANTGTYRGGARRVGARSLDMERINYPLHHYLKRYDIVAFMQALRQGIQPFQQDGDGFNALDLVVRLIEEMLEGCLCSSLPLDLLVNDSINSKGSGKSVFQNRSYEDAYSRMYSRPGRMRMPQSGEKHLRPRAYTDLQKDHSQNIDVYSKEKVDGGDERKPLYVSSNFMGAGKSTYESKLYHNHVSNAVKESINLGMPRKAQVKLKELQGRISGLCRAAQELASCDDLVAVSLDHMIKLRDPPIQGNSRGVGVLFTNQTYPYLYMSCVEMLWEYWADPSKCSPNSNADSSSLPAIEELFSYITKKSLLGHQLLQFIATCLDGICVLLSIFGGQTMRMPMEILEYYLHASFVLRKPELFTLLCEHVSVRESDILGAFSWDSLLEYMCRKPEKYSKFMMALTKMKLRHEAYCSTLSNRGTRLSPRQYTGDMMNSIKDNLGGQAHQVASRELSKWKYPVYKEEKTHTPAPIPEMPKLAEMKRKTETINKESVMVYHPDSLQYHPILDG